MLKKQRKSSLKNKKGMAALEMIPLLMIIMLLVNFSLGFFGAIHTGILNSIAARNYTFEIFRNRANLVYFKNTDTGQKSLATIYDKVGMRIHGTTTESSNDELAWYATARTIDFVDKEQRAAEVVGNDSSTHDKSRAIPDGRNTTVGVNPIWIKTTYGICLDANCGS